MIKLKPKTKRVFLKFVLPMGCLFGVIALIWKLMPTDYEREMPRFAQFVKSSSINPTNLQVWATNYLQSSQPDSIPYENLPTEIRTLYAEKPDAFVTQFQGSAERVLIITWGGAFLHTGLCVGGPGCKLPERKRYDDFSMYLVEWIPGVYFATY